MLQLGGAISEIVAEYDQLAVALARGLAALLAVWVVGWWLAVPAIRRVIAARNPRNRTLNNAIVRYVRVIVVVLAAVVGIVTAGFGYVLTGSALVVAAATLALGVAGQEVIGNLVSGVFLVADPDFNVDDWIVWADGEGVVESISLRVTRVRTQNNEVVVVPNTVLATGQVTRPYGREAFRVTVELTVDVDTDLEPVFTALREEALSVGGVVDDPRPTVRATAFGDGSVLLRVELWIRDPERTDVVRVRSTFLRRVADRFDDIGVAVSPASEHELSGELSIDRVDRDPE